MMETAPKSVHIQALVKDVNQFVNALKASVTMHGVVWGKWVKEIMIFAESLLFVCLGFFVNIWSLYIHFYKDHTRKYPSMSTMMTLGITMLALFSTLIVILYVGTYVVPKLRKVKPVVEIEMMEYKTV